jgi:hypothetical protein
VREDTGRHLAVELLHVGERVMPVHAAVPPVVRMYGPSTACKVVACLFDRSLLCSHKRTNTPIID